MNFHIKIISKENILFIFRSKVSNHPILKLAKYVTLYEDERQEKFWDLIFRGKAEYQLSY